MHFPHFAFALTAVLIWVGNTIVSKLAAHEIPPGTIAFERWIIAFLVLTPFVFRSAWKQRETIFAHLPKLIALGALGMAACQGMGYYAAQFTTATNIGLILALVPLLTMVLSSIFLRELPSRTALAGSAIALVGICIILGQGSPAQLLTQGIGLGDALMILAVTAYAGYGILLRQWQIPLPTWVSVYAQVGSAVIILLPFFLLSPEANMTASNISLVLYAAIPGSILAPFVWISAVQKLGAARTAIFMNLIPIITALVAAAFLNENLYTYHFIGGLLSIGGVVLVQRAPNRISVPAAPTAKVKEKQT